MSESDDLSSTAESKHIHLAWKQYHQPPSSNPQGPKSLWWYNHITKKISHPEPEGYESGDNSEAPSPCTSPSQLLSPALSSASTVQPTVSTVPVAALVPVTERNTLATIDSLKNLSLQDLSSPGSSTLDKGK